jgi:hypothetical protein
MLWCMARMVEIGEVARTAVCRMWMIWEDIRDSF